MSGTTDQHRQYGRNGCKVKIIILLAVTEAMARLVFFNPLWLSLDGRVGPLHHLSALLHLAWPTSPSLTLICLSLRIVRAGVPAGWLYVAKLVVGAVVAGRADLTSSVAVMHWLADLGLRWTQGGTR